MKHALLTGANGFTGYYITQALLRRGFRVTATGLGPARLPFTEEKFDYLPMDFTRPESVNEVLSAVRPDIIIHGGALSKPDECAADKRAAFLVNVSGTVNLLQGAAATGHPHFIFLSTDFVFSGKEGPYREEDGPAPVNYYGETKWLAEGEVQQYSGSWAIARTVLVYGKSHSGRDNFIIGIANKLKEGTALRIFGDQVRTPTYVEDFAWGVARIAELGSRGVYHLSGPDQQTPYSMAVATARALGLDEALIREEREETFPQPERRPKVTGFILDKARRDLGYDPLPFEEGLKRTLA